MKSSPTLLIYIAFFTSIISQAETSKPNILFIMSDDHTSQAIGVYASHLAKLNPTPNIDKLAREGAILSNTFCTNSICSPSRASIMTGQYSAINGVSILAETLPVKRQFLAHEMKKAGYQTAVIGKWHLKSKPEAFDFYKVLKGQGDYFNPSFFVKGQDEMVRMEGHSSDCITDAVLDYLKNRDNSKPFFLKYHFKAPHDMFENAPRYDSYLENVEIPEPASLWEQSNHGSLATRGHNDELRNKIGTSVGKRNPRRNMGLDLASTFPNEKINPDLSAKEYKRQAYQQYLKKYLRCVKGVDDNIQRVIDLLKAEGIYDNTVIIYTGDQGFMLGEHDYIDKRWAYEESMRMPFIIRYPKSIKAGSQFDFISENVDFAPTMLDFAGVNTPEYMQGTSFKDELESGVENSSTKQAAYYHYWMNMFHHDNPAHIAIRTKTHKLILFYGSAWSNDPLTPPAWELYDLIDDPNEMNNIYNDSANKDLILSLKTQLKQMRSEYREDDKKYPFNEIIEEYWDYDQADLDRAIQISNNYAKQETRKNFSADWNSLNSRPSPQWYEDAKFGIFIHWGLYSVPSYAPQGHYAEWYWYDLISTPPPGVKHKIYRHQKVNEFHNKVYGKGFPYKNFREQFTCEMFNPDQWAKIFKKSGAKYIVLTSKHHDGYTLWPSKHASKSFGMPWNSVDSGPGRDLCQELADSVRSVGGIKMGYYYSLWDWFNPYNDSMKVIRAGDGTHYKKYIKEVLYPQFRELVQKYKPALLFSDGDWLADDNYWETKPLLAQLYNSALNRDEVIINDRWGKGRGKNGGYYTTEYGSGFENVDKPWEENRGMGHSFGFNRNEDFTQYNSTKELVFMLVDLVSRGGNLLLNIGPTSDGRIPVFMQNRLVEIGQWLDVNGEAIYGTKPWIKSCQWSKGNIPKFNTSNYKSGFPIFEVTLNPKPGNAHKQLYFTQKNDTLYGLMPVWPRDGKIEIKDVKLSDNSKVTLLGVDEDLQFTKTTNGIEIILPQLNPTRLPCKDIFTLKISYIQ